MKQLSISDQTIVAGRGGKFTCQSTLGMGTELAIALPIRQWVSKTP